MNNGRGSSSIRLLIVDDDQSRRTMLATFFRHHGYVADTLPDGRHLLEQVVDDCPDVIVLDVMLPEHNGIELCRQLREQEGLDATPVILITAACHDEESIVNGLTCGADDYVIMPASLAEIHARVRVQLRNRRDRKLLRSTREQRDRYMDEAYRDPLTQIGNRRACEREIREVLAANVPFLLMMIDIDHFKRVNDSFGHLVGDEVLRRVGQKLNQLPRRGDFVGRYGGEEFAVITRGTGHSVAASIGDRFRQAIADLPMPADLPMRGITISIGIVSYPAGQDKTRVEEVIEQADMALYRAKEGGRNRVVVCSPDGA